MEPSCTTFKNKSLILQQGTMKIPRMWATKMPYRESNPKVSCYCSSTRLFSLPYLLCFDAHCYGPP
jgi:hypothetical protein